MGLLHNSRGQGVTGRNRACELPNVVPGHAVSDEYWFLLLARCCLPRTQPQIQPLCPMQTGFINQTQRRIFSAIVKR